MDILVFGGTRLMGKHLVNELLAQGHQVTIATRGLTADNFGPRVQRIQVERYDGAAIKMALASHYYDVVYDSLAYSSLDVKTLLDAVCCKRYIMISSAAVYESGLSLPETTFDPATQPVIWCSRNDFSYAETKRQAERALAQCYPELSWAAVRFPFVIGPDDYTRRLAFYTEHLLQGVPMFLDNLTEPLSFVGSRQAGQFLAFLAGSSFCGPVNAAAQGSATLQNILEYAQQKTGRAALLAGDGAPGPYNGARACTLSLSTANALGFCFAPLHQELYPLVDKLLTLRP